MKRLYKHIIISSSFSSSFALTFSSFFFLYYFLSVVSNMHSEALRYAGLLGLGWVGFCAPNGVLDVFGRFLGPVYR